MSDTVIIWFRRDLRVRDHPALCAASAAGQVLPVAILDPALAGATGAKRRTHRWLASVAALNADLDGRLVVRRGRPESVLPRLAHEVAASAVHISAETTPYGRRRDAGVAARLGEIPLVRTGSPYAVGPGTLRTGVGTPYRVFTPFLRAWRQHGRPAPAPAPHSVQWLTGVTGNVRLPDPPQDVGERAALTRWHRFRHRELASYAEGRDLPAIDATSRMSVPLKYGEIHPRTLLTDVDPAAPGGERFVAELAWREFYADVVWHHPGSVWSDWRPLHGVDYHSVGEQVDVWQQGRTGYPFVDAGMRQLAAEGWMHNRVRMVTASFLTKDLHVWWPTGARHFLAELVDGDIASNNHGWQWVAGTGTDAAPYHRILNPVRQGLRFDPDGEYVRRWVPELRHLAGAAAHQPWNHDDGYTHGYPRRLIDHAEERRLAVAITRR